MWYEDLETGFILPNSQDLEKTFVFNYGMTVLMWNLFVTAAHSCVQYKNEMDGTTRDELEEAWKGKNDYKILSQFAKKFRPDLKGKFDTLLDKRNELVHQPVKDISRQLTAAGMADLSRPISDADMHLLMEKQDRFKEEMRPYTNIAMDTLQSISTKYEKWKSGIVR